MSTCEFGLASSEVVSVGIASCLGKSRPGTRFRYLLPSQAGVAGNTSRASPWSCLGNRQCGTALVGLSRGQFPRAATK